MRISPRQRAPVSAMRIERPRGEALLATAFALAFVAAAWATGLLVRARPAPILGAGEFTQDLWYAGLFKGVVLLALPLAWLRTAGYRFDDLSPGDRGGTRSVLVLAGLFLAGGLLNAGHLGPIREGLARFTPAGAAGRVALGLLLPLFTAAIPEEVVYRGVLQTRLERELGRASAVVLSVALFTAWHLPTRWLLAHGLEGRAGDLVSVLLGTALPVAVAGLGFALAWDRWRNLPALVAVHWGVDLLPAVRSLLGDRF
jgi:membrane protease YdiL (CAAX protease family)